MADQYTSMILATAARACVRENMSRRDAVLAFMSAFDDARTAIRPGPIVLPAVGPVPPGSQDQELGRIGSRLSAKAMRQVLRVDVHEDEKKA